MIFVRPNASPSHSLIVGIAAALVVFGTAAVSGGALYLRARDALNEEVRSDLRRTAVVAAASIDVSLHQKLTDPAQEDGPEYQQAIIPLRNIRRASTSIKYIYTVILKEDSVYYVLDPTPKGDADKDGKEDHSNVMDRVDNANAILRGVLSGGPAVAESEPVVDEWGITMSGYAPFHDDLGNTVGVVGVDIDLVTFDERMAGMRYAMGMGALLALICSMLVGVVVTRTTSSLRRARLAADENAKVLKAERQEAERANRAKDEFLAVMTHEIRTPLNAVIGLADLLIAGEMIGDQRRHLSTIRASGEHLLSMINDILDHSKIDAGHMTLEEAPFSLRESAEEVISLMRESAHVKGLFLELSIEGPVSERVTGDAMRLRQVMINLISNAVKFTATGGVTLKLHASTPGGTTTISVIDTGVGIDEFIRNKLFRPFTQGDSSISRRFGGTGLGLSISQRLVKLMGGNITVESAPGRGSAFAFTLALPATTTPTTKVIRSLPNAQLPIISGRVLVVDDREVNRQVAMAMVRRLGVEVEEVADGRNALARIALGGIDLVLMDCQMPDQDGLATTALLRLGESPGTHLPVVALSAAVLPADRERCRQVGMDGFLSKPIRLDLLAEELSRFLSKHADSDTVGSAPQPKVGVDQPPVLDAQVAATLRTLDRDPAAFQQLIDTYLREASNTIAGIVFDGVSARRDDLAARAHGMKGAALTIGLSRLALALEAFEQVIIMGDDQALAGAATDLELVFAEGVVALTNERNRSPG